MKKRKPQMDNAGCPPGSLEQQLDMCESGSLRGDDQLREFHGHPNFREDMAEDDREGDEMSGDEHSNGLQGGDSEFNEQERENGLPGDETRIEDLRARRMNLPEEPEPEAVARFERIAQQVPPTGSQKERLAEVRELRRTPKSAPGSKKRTG